MEAEENKIADSIKVSTQKLASTNEEINKARQMVARAQAILGMAELAHYVETNKLIMLIARSICVQELEAKKAPELELARTHLAEMANIDREVLKQQTIARAEENKKNRLSSLEAKL